MVPQRNQRFRTQSGFFDSYNTPWSKRSLIDLFSKEMQNPFSGSLRFKNPILDFLKEMHEYMKDHIIIWIALTSSQLVW